MILDSPVRYMTVNLPLPAQVGLPIPPFTELSSSELAHYRIARTL